MTAHEHLLIIDFGSQVTQLIARRVRESGVYCEIHPYNKVDAAFLDEYKPKAIILRTLPGKGVARIEASEKSHFFHVDVAEWDGIIADFEQNMGAQL